MSEHKKKKHKSGKSKEISDLKDPKEPKGVKKAKPAKDPAAPKVSKPAAVKSRAKKAPSATSRKKTTTSEPAIHLELISMRAYFISEKRRAHGEHGDEHGDWIEAERQLKAEARRG